jgi:hypothetical protein
MAADVVFVVNPVAWDHAFKSWQGPVGRAMVIRTEETLVAAVVEAPGPGKLPRNRTGINYSTGALESDIRSSRGHWVGPGGRELEGRVTSRARHSQWVHEGTPPHVITPHVPSSWLRFPWKKLGGKVVFAKVVHHPGTAANDFLVRALKKAIT